MTLGNGDPSGRNWTPGDAPHNTATFLLAEHLGGAELFEGLDDLFDPEKVSRIIARAVERIKQSIDRIMPALDRVDPRYRQIITNISDQEGVDFNQVAAEYITQEAFFLMVSDLFGLIDSGISPNTPSGAFALTYNHSLVAVSPESPRADDETGPLPRRVMTYSRMPSRKSGTWEGDMTRKYENKPLGSAVRVGHRCKITEGGIETSDLRMVRSIPYNGMSIDHFERSTRTMVDGFTATRSRQAGRKPAIPFIIIPDGRDGERNAQRQVAAEPLTRIGGGAGPLDVPAAELLPPGEEKPGAVGSNRLIAMLKKAGIL